MVLDCDGCGKRFRSSNRPGSACIKCEKLLEASGKTYASPDAKADALNEIKVNVHVLYRDTFL